MTQKNSINIQVRLFSILAAFGFILFASNLQSSASGQEITWDNASSFAYDFVKSSPTFSFDGIEESLRVDWARVSPNNSNEFGVSLTFDSAHAGYGDRTGLVLAQVITTHSIHVKILDGKVTYAVMDGVWDELNQKFLSENYVPGNNLSPESKALELAQAFVKSSPTFSYDGIEPVKYSSVKTLKSLPPQYVIDASFDSANAGYGNRSDQTVAQVVTSHTISIKVVEDKIVSAVIDGVWDELNQQFLKLPSDLNDLPLEYESITSFDPASTSPRVKLNSTNVIQNGRTVSFDDGKFTLTFSKLIQDSRCPADVVCVHQGDATIKVGIGSADKNLRDLELSLHQDNVPQKLLNRYFIKLADLQPYPSSDKKISESDYIATILISSFDIHPPRVQLEYGLDSSEVICKDGLVLIKKLSKGTVGCVTDSTAQKLIKRAWGIT